METVNMEIDDPVADTNMCWDNLFDNMTSDKLNLFLHNEEFMRYIRDPTNNISNRVYRTILDKDDADMLALIMNLCFLYIIFPPNVREYDFADTLLMIWAIHLVQKIE